MHGFMRSYIMLAFIGYNERKRYMSKFKVNTKVKIFEVPTGHKNIPKGKVFKHKNDRRKEMKTKRELIEW